jgi:methyltransferase
LNPSILLLAYVTAARLGELWISRRNTAALVAAGAIEHAPRHYPLIVALHTAWIAGLWWLARDRPISPLWFAAFVLLQGLRFWTLATLGRRFTTRIITLPGEVLVKRGPYRFLRHPNYAVVIGELAVLPLTFGLWSFALGFSLLNAVALTVRIRAEDRALATLRHG